jgi:hypothetical protein
LGDPDEVFYSQKDDTYSIADSDHYNNDSDDSSDSSRWHSHKHPAVNFVYDAVAERTQQRLKEGHQNLLINGVH